MRCRGINKFTLSNNYRRKQATRTSIIPLVVVKKSRAMRRYLASKGFLCRRRIRSNITFRILRNKKIPLYQVPLATVKVTLHALKWIFILVLLYLTIGFIILLAQEGMRSIRDIVIYGITGFITFFMGYFGWMFARNVIEIINGRRIRNEDPEL